MASRQNTLIIGLSVVLALVAVISIGLLVVVPSDPDSDVTDAPTADTDVLVTPPGGQVFNLSAIQSQLYEALDKQLIREGALPVQPPAVIGKVNPFL